MKMKFRQHLPGQRSLPAVLAIIALATLSSPGTAAATTAKATILNVAQVSYKDVAGQNEQFANAATTVTVNLLPANPSLYAAPSGGGAPGLPGCPTVTVYASGTTATSLYALAANANGSDSYTLKFGSGGTTANIIAGTDIRKFTPFTYNGTMGATITDPASSSITLKSAIPIGISVAVGETDDTLLFPGGSLATQGFAANDIVLVEVLNGSGVKVKKLFLVAQYFPGTSPATNRGAAGPYTDVVAATGDTPDRLQLKAFTDVTVAGQNVGGGGVAPAFDDPLYAPTIGVPVGQVVLLKVDITGSTTVASGNSATVGFGLESPVGTPLKTCTVDHFLAPTLSINKAVRNVTTPASGATGKPLEILEYEVTVSNSSLQAGYVQVTDTVPTYTTLMTSTAAYGTNDANGTVGSHIFATITSRNALGAAVRTVPVTMSNADNEDASVAPVAKVGYGNASGTTPAVGALTFYMGDAAANNAGGKLPACSDTTYTTQATCETASKHWITSYKILYQVKID